MDSIPRTKGITSFTLHLLAMGLMLCDHLWATVVYGAGWLTWLGRIAFPIFAFMVAEGFCHTKSFKKYLIRLLILAFISEIPFNLMYGGSIIYPFHQNVIWTFLIALLCIKGIDSAKKKGRLWLTVLAVAGLGLVGFIAGMLLMTDYYGFGVLTVIIFYVFRGRKLWQVSGQIAGVFYINAVLLGGLSIPVSLFGISFDLPQQAFAMLAFVPILLYRGEQGPHGKAVRYAFYAFYPLHMLILSVIALCF